MNLHSDGFKCSLAVKSCIKSLLNIAGVEFRMRNTGRERLIRTRLIRSST